MATTRHWLCVRFFGGLLGGLAACHEGDAHHEDAYQGIVEFEERVLAFEVPGHVRDLKVRQGDQVAAGAELASLDDTLETLRRDQGLAQARAVSAELKLLEAGSRVEDIRATQADLAAAREDLRMAERTASRAQKVQSAGATTPAELDATNAAVLVARARVRRLEETSAKLKGGARAEELEAARARVEAANAEVRSADARIARHLLRAPVDGVVLDVFLESGEFAAVGGPVVTLADPSRSYVDIFVPEGKIADLQLDDALEVRIDGLAEPLAGRVEHLSRRTEFTPKFLFSPRERPNLVLRVRVRVADPDLRLRAGVPAFVRAIRPGKTP